MDGHSSPRKEPLFQMNCFVHLFAFELFPNHLVVGVTMWPPFMMCSVSRAPTRTGFCFSLQKSLILAVTTDHAHTSCTKSQWEANNDLFDCSCHGLEGFINKFLVLWSSERPRCNLNLSPAFPTIAQVSPLPPCTVPWRDLSNTFGGLCTSLMLPLGVGL